MRFRLVLGALGVLATALAYVHPPSSLPVSHVTTAGLQSPPVFAETVKQAPVPTITLPPVPVVTLPTTTTTTAPPPPTSAPTTTTEAPPPPTTEAPEPAPADPPPTQWDGTVEGAVRYWFPANFDSAWNVSGCESGHDPGAVSPGGGNYGLFQINNVHRDDFTAITGQPWSAWSDAYYNSEYARHLYDAQGWGPWTCRWAA